MTSDDAARARIAGELETSFIVEAAAGAGKTSALVARLLAVLRAGAATLPQVVAVTFTDKAAGEMKLRLRGELEAARAAAAGVEEERLRAALADLEAARVGTFHSICGDLLRDHPVEARVDPRFELAAGDEADRLLDEAFDGWLQHELADPPEGVRRLLRRRPRGRDATPRRLLRDAAGRRVGARDFDAPWRRDPFDRPAALRAAAAAVAPQLSADRRHEVTQRSDDLDGLEALLHDIAGDRGQRLPADARAVLDDALARADADVAACLHAELAGVVARYQALTAAAGRLDFLDLLLRCRDLLRDDAQVREELHRRITHVFVDEVQDVDPLQAEILLLLASPGRLFAVGDPKQSIYRFRRADVAFYGRLKAELRARGAQMLELGDSFRAGATLIEAVNASFAPAMRASPGQPAYAPLRARRADLEGQPPLVALPLPLDPFATRAQLDAACAAVTTAFIEELLGGGWRTGEGERVEARHVCLLLKRFQSFGADATRPYARALEARGIAHVLVGGRSFHAREEVIALRALLRAVEWPDDPLAVYAALRGPFFALSDEELLLSRERLSPLVVTAEGRVGDALAALARAHARRSRRPIADTIAELLETTRAAAGLALWPNGEQALANVGRVQEQARRFEAAGATSFRAFVERLEDEAAAGETGDAPVVEEGTEGVRIMTVHRAKGLEFPVVILGDPTAARAPKTPTRHVDPERGLWLEPLAGCAPAELRERQDEARARDEEEGVRLAYVAATRARDLLVLPVVGTAPPTGWLDVLGPAAQRARRWDLRGLRLDVPRGAGVRHDALLEDGPGAEEGRRAVAAWRARRAEVTAAAARPTLVARAAAAAAPGASAGVETIVARVPGPRPGGRRFGALVHAALATIDLATDDVALAVAAAARTAGASAEEAEAARAVVARAWAHPLVRRAAAALEARREVAVHLRLADGTIAEGVADLAFREADGWTVVDWKTDADVEQHLARYEAQVALYAEAIAAATGEPAVGVLLIV